MAKEAGDGRNLITFTYDSGFKPEARHTTISTYDAAGRLLARLENVDGVVGDSDKDKGPEPDSDPPIII
jgi:hypothetical protein